MNNGGESDLRSFGGAALLDQLVRYRWGLAFIYVPTLLMIATLIVITQMTELEIRSFFIDPVSAFRAPMYIGFVSNLGVVLWCSAAAVCLFGGLLLVRRSDRRKDALFLLSAGTLSTILMFDDLFLLHEEIMPERLGIPQPLVFGLYGGALVGFLVLNRHRILRSPYLLLLISLGFFAVSIGFDLLELLFDTDMTVPGIDQDLLEDAPKFMGIEAWALYLWITAYAILHEALGNGHRT